MRFVGPQSNEPGVVAATGVLVRNKKKKSGFSPQALKQSSLVNNTLGDVVFGDMPWRHNSSLNLLGGSRP